MSRVPPCPSRGQAAYSGGVPAADVDVDVSHVRGLLASLPPEVAHLRDAPLTLVTKGWDNSVWRVGDHHAIRVVVREVAAPVVSQAARWIPEATAPLRDLGFRVPVPIHSTPEWSLVSWVPGDVLNSVPVEQRELAADDLADALAALHRPAPLGAPINPYRGVPLADRRHLADRHAEGGARFLGRRTTDRLLALLDEAIAAPPWPHPPVWCHGDLHDLNLTLDRSPSATGRRLGFLDFDDLTAGDPAVDLRVLWISLNPTQRERATRLLKASGAYDPAIWRRAKGWAASSFVIPIAADEESRETFAPAIRRTIENLGCG